MNSFDKECKFVRDYCRICKNKIFHCGVALGFMLKSQCKHEIMESEDCKHFEVINNIYGITSRFGGE